MIAASYSIEFPNPLLLGLTGLAETNPFIALSDRAAISQSVPQIDDYENLLRF